MIENARRRPWALLIVIVLAAVAGACGNKDDLYLPDETPPGSEQGE